MYDLEREYEDLDDREYDDRDREDDCLRLFLDFFFEILFFFVRPCDDLDDRDVDLVDADRDRLDLEDSDLERDRDSDRLLREFLRLLFLFSTLFLLTAWLWSMLAVSSISWTPF